MPPNKESPVPAPAPAPTSAPILSTPTEKVDVLRAALYKVGICPDCGHEREHAVSEPFSYCACGTTEDTEGPPVLQRLRHLLLEIVSAWELKPGVLTGALPPRMKPIYEAAQKELEGQPGKWLESKTSLLQRIREHRDSLLETNEELRFEVKRLTQEMGNYLRSIEKAHSVLDGCGLIKPKEISCQGLVPRIKSLVARADELSGLEAQVERMGAQILALKDWQNRGEYAERFCEEMKKQRVAMREALNFLLIGYLGLGGDPKSNCARQASEALADMPVVQSDEPGSPSELEVELARRIVWRVCNLPFATYKDANDDIAQVLANARVGYVEPVAPPTFVKCAEQTEGGAK